MIRQMCDEDEGLHRAGLQFTMYSDIKEFYESATELAIVAQLLWVITILRELNTIFSFSRAFTSMKRGQDSIVSVDSDPSNPIPEEVDPTNPVHTDIALQFTQITFLR